ncbi:MAG: enoyl-CoA hydratase/isomerase family protein [Alphaproteobacteria bacterium]|nr:enoyl-CoA hydratase/isomerase family protein [Alphaproteobacteria bacterium]
MTLNRPTRLNALDAALRQALVDALAAAAGDDGVRAVIITGAGDRAFCAGQDLNESEQLGEEDSAAWLESWRSFFDAFANFPKPLVAAVNGVAAGGGFEIAMLAHLRVAAPEARFLMAEINIGLPCIVGSFLVQQHLFFSRMVEILLSGRSLDSREAREIGMVHRIAPRGRLEAAALAAAEQLAAKPPVAMRLNIQRFNALRRASMTKLGVEQALHRLHSEALQSGEPQQVMAEFLAERARRRAQSEKAKFPRAARAAPRKGA